MNDREALERAILLKPREDTPRLALADELDALGENERAEFIRVQVELSRHPLPPLADGRQCGCGGANTGCPWCPLERRGRALWGANKTAWFGERWAVLCLSTDDAEHYPYPYLIAAVVRRGFVDEVLLTAAAFLGGPCELCAELSENTIARNTAAGIYCSMCKGEGTTPGRAAAIFAAHPVTKVVLTDKSPQYTGSHTGIRGDWAWFRADIYAPEESNLPGEVFWLLDGYLPDRLPNEGGHWRDYPSEKTANDALSRALVKLGRKLANLE